MEMNDILLAVGLLMTIWSWRAALSRKRRGDSSGALILGLIATAVMLAAAWKLAFGG